MSSPALAGMLQRLSDLDDLTSDQTVLCPRIVSPEHVLPEPELFGLPGDSSVARLSVPTKLPISSASAIANPQTETAKLCNSRRDAHD